MYWLGGHVLHFHNKLDHLKANDVVIEDLIWRWIEHWPGNALHIAAIFACLQEKPSRLYVRKIRLRLDVVSLLFRRAEPDWLKKQQFFLRYSLNIPAFDFLSVFQLLYGVNCVRILKSAQRRYWEPIERRACWKLKPKLG